MTTAKELQTIDPSSQGMVMNPFATALTTHRETNVVSDIVGMREAQEVQAMIAVAKRFPRNTIQAMDRILQSCARQGLADGAVYQYGRGGSNITGPSIRLAEAIAQNWGNFQFGWRELARGKVDNVGYSDVEAYAWDLETNTRKPICFRVRHWRDTNKGGYALKDERDIYELTANQAARRVRNCILAVIPGDVTEAAVQQCELTLKTHCDCSPEAVKKMVDAFIVLGVTRSQIETRIQRRLDSITPALVLQMKKIYASLRDGMSSVADWFSNGEIGNEIGNDPAPTSPNRGSDALKSRMLARQQREKINESLVIAGAMPGEPPADMDAETGELLPLEEGDVA